MVAHIHGFLLRPLDTRPRALREDPPLTIGTPKN